MSQWMSGMGGLEVLFIICTAIGGVLFLVRLVLLLVGHDADADVDATDVHAAADNSFRLLSVQSLTSFFLMFGLVGLACTRHSGIHPALAVGAGALAGAGTVYVIDRIFRGMNRLQSDGTIDLSRAVGLEGTVYLTVKPGTGGQVRLAIQGRLQVFAATVAEGDAIPTGMPVIVTAVTGGNVLEVKPKRV